MSALARVYFFEPDGSWKNHGDGHVSCEDGQVTVFGMGEEEILLHIDLERIEQFQRQSEKTITWHDPIRDTEMALSFNQRAACDLLWSVIEDIVHQHPAFQGDPVGAEEISIVEPTEDNLFEFVTTLAQVQPKARILTAKYMLENGYVDRLVEIAAELEKASCVEPLCFIGDAFRAMVMLNSVDLLQVLVSDKYYLQVFGAMENDRDLPEKPMYREYLTRGCIFKKVVDIKDKFLLELIHEVFRVSYLKDVVMARHLDDETFSSLYQFIYIGNSNILECFKTQDGLLRSLFDILEVPESEKSLDGLMLLRELFMIARLTDDKGQFFQMLSTDFDFLDVLLPYFEDARVRARATCYEMFQIYLIRQTNVTRVHMVTDCDDIPSSRTDDGKYPHMSLLSRRLKEETDFGSIIQIGEVMRQLVVSPDPAMSKALAGAINSSWLERLIQLGGDSGGKVNRRATAFEVLGACVTNLLGDLKYFLFRSNVYNMLKDVMANCTSKIVILSALQFLRDSIKCQDEYLNQHMISAGIGSSLMRLFEENLNSYNMLNSCIVGILDLISKEKIVKWERHLAEDHHEILEKVDYVTTCHDILEWESRLNVPTPPAGSTSSESIALRENALQEERDEEDRFFSEVRDACDDVNVDDGPKESEENGDGEELKKAIIGMQRRREEEEDDDDELDLEWIKRRKRTGAR
eukprot:TRINITY_DN525_c1_g1_i1.p1 TRINITY_DN525_c1_g1~~TRINITY_DN525_c1_g1_i1.p1  ORF type:complete len:692 (+),score=170.96 TRINITY_DN525_c1_g1_i1:215-2290(+)